MRTLPLALIALACLATALPATAQSACDWTLVFGTHHLDAKSDTCRLAPTAHGTSPQSICGNTHQTIALEYLRRDRVGIEMLTATPFSHDLDIT